MKHLGLILLLLILAISTNMVKAQTAPAKQWDKRFGGTLNDQMLSIQQTTDGGYIAGGSSSSGIGGDKTHASKGGDDFWLVKVDASGNKQWDKTYGGNDDDFLYRVIQTSDGGYLLGGTTYSGISGDKSQASKGEEDYWILKLDAAGNKQWDKTFGGSDLDEFYYLEQTNDGGYILGGKSSSNISGDKTQNSKGGEDYWVIKVDASGNKQWDKTFGGNTEEFFSIVKQTPDGGYLVGGSSRAGISGDKTQSSNTFDYWVVKLDGSGNKLWDKTYTGLNTDLLSTIQPTADGGFIVGGTSSSGIGGDKSQTFNGADDYWIIKIDANGNKIWDKSFGGNGVERLDHVQQTTDGGYMLAGQSDSGISGDKSQACQGMADYWLVKVDAAGAKQWDVTFGGDEPDFLNSAIQTSDGGYILGGGSYSNLTGDKSQASQGSADYWVVKLGPGITRLPENNSQNFNLYPNPTSGIINLELKHQQPNQVSVYNSLGQCILNKVYLLIGPDKNIQFDLSKEAKGIYIIQVISGNHIAIKKINLQ